MGFTLVTVSATYHNEDGTLPTPGSSVTLQATATMQNGTEIRVPTRFSANLDGAGAISIQVPATDDVGTQPLGVSYEVIERISGTYRKWLVVVPHTSPTLNLASAAPALPANAVFGYALDSQVVHQAGAETITGVKLTAEEFRTAKNPYDPRYYGAKIDGQFVSDGVMNGTTAVLTSASNKFVAADVGKLCLVPGAGAAGALLTTTIASYQNAGQVTLAAASQTAVGAALVTWGTDDSAAWVTTYAAAPAGAKVVIPWGYSLYRGSFMGGISKSLTLEGLGVSPIQSSGVLPDTPNISPYLLGSVIVQCQAGQNGLDITGSLNTVHRRHFGIKFADGIKFVNTGHGIYSVATTMVSGGHDVCDFSSRTDTVYVFGHDGNHYGRYSVNSMDTTSTHTHSWGGGVLYMECDSFILNTGNAVEIRPQGVVLAGGTAHAFAMKGRTSAQPGVLNLLEFLAPNCSIESVPTAFSGLGISSTSAAQYLWRTLGSSAQFVGIRDPDLESVWASPADFGGTGVSVDVNTGGSGLIGGGAITYPNIVLRTPLFLTGAATFYADGHTVFYEATTLAGDTSVYVNAKTGFQPHLFMTVNGVNQLQLTGTNVQAQFFTDIANTGNYFELGASGGVTVLHQRGTTTGFTFEPTVITVASATGRAGLRLPHGAAPTSPVDGDMWSTTAGLFIRVNGVTKTVTLT